MQHGWNTDQDKLLAPFRATNHQFLRVPRRFLAMNEKSALIRGNSVLLIRNANYN